MALRDELIATVDAVRQDVLVDATGLRLHRVRTRRRTWAGPQRGVGGYSDELVELTPRPRVTPAHSQPGTEAGKRETGEVTVSRVSATYTEADLTGGPLGPLEEWSWLVDDREYQLQGRPEAGYLGWTVQLRRLGGRP